MNNTNDEAKWIDASQKLDLTENDLETILNSEIMGQVFGDLDICRSVAIQTLWLLAGCISAGWFKAIYNASAVYTVIGGALFYGEADEKTIGSPNWRTMLMAHITVFIAGTEGAAAPADMLNKIMTAIPYDAKLSEMVKLFEFENKTTDWTPFLIESYHTAKAEANTQLKSAMNEVLPGGLNNPEQVEPVMGTRLEPLDLKKKSLN